MNEHDIQRRLDSLDLDPVLRSFLAKHPEMLLPPHEVKTFNTWFAKYKLRQVMGRMTAERN